MSDTSYRVLDDNGGPYLYARVFFDPPVVEPSADWDTWRYRDGESNSNSPEVSKALLDRLFMDNPNISFEANAAIYTQAEQELRLYIQKIQPVIDEVNADWCEVEPGKTE